MSHFLDEKTALLAIRVASASIQYAMGVGVASKPCLHIVVLDPVKYRGTCSFEEAILAEESIGRNSWQRDYSKIARSKAELTWRTGMSTRVLQEHAPHLLEKGDTFYGGSAIRHGVVVGCSGVQSHIDEACAYTVADWCVALAIGNRKAADQSTSFIQ